ncbi:hypothetical protein E4U40_003009 [Claviceps sp. LM458 group G5]|nr:hypothetical protein E4U40_003009 [Claviceps sp. LM458 group G5]
MELATPVTLHNRILNKARIAAKQLVHRRIIVRDYGKPIYRASSRLALLACLEGCIAGHESLYEAGILHRDISLNNLMINEESETNQSWRHFLIDLDQAIYTDRHDPSERTKVGIRIFMAIGLLDGEDHSFLHDDLESFFWVFCGYIQMASLAKALAL